MHLNWLKLHIFCIFSNREKKRICFFATLVTFLFNPNPRDLDLNNLTKKKQFFFKIQLLKYLECVYFFLLICF